MLANLRRATVSSLATRHKLRDTSLIFQALAVGSSTAAGRSVPQLYHFFIVLITIRWPERSSSAWPA
jgi:hypothetical protein